MTEPIREVPVTIKVPIDVYLVIERKATAGGITAGRLLAEFLIASIRASLDGGPTFAFRKGAKHRGYVRITERDLPALRQMIRDGASLKVIAARFRISVSSAGNWRRRILEEDAAAQNVAEAA